MAKREGKESSNKGQQLYPMRCESSQALIASRQWVQSVSLEGEDGING